MIAGMPKISWAVRAHQALRFFPDESVGYQYPEAYTKWFGPDFQPDDLRREASPFLEDDDPAEHSTQ